MDTIIAVLLLAIATVESNCDAYAVSPNGREVGILQISEDMVDDCNRIVGEERYNYEDRLDIVQSYEMAATYWDHYGFTQPEEMARSWNGGPDGDWQDCTLIYWEKVKAEMERL